MKRIYVLVIMLLMVVGAGCNRGESSSTTPDGTSQVAASGASDSSLSANHWKLVDATTAGGERIDALFPNAERPVQLDFADGRVSVSNACNRMGGTFAVEGGAYTVGDLMQTEMACEAPLMDAERAIAAALSSGGTVQVEGDSLVLVTAGGDTLRFEGEPTAETRYGGPGERVFLEIAAQRVPCSHGMIPNYQCLNVREVRYDDNGTKVGEGEWEYLYQNIEGFTHEPGIRNVVRVTRYNVENPPADGSSIAYVLDMVVESEQVAQ